ncbi:MAG: hypothetical protein ABIV21_08165 [Pyrinomonadaceae bacterium]
MIDPDSIAEIIATYTKHGWILRRVLLSGEARAVLGASIDRLFRNIPVTDSAIDAAWFSRQPTGSSVAWEIRYFGSMPFALLENIDESDPGFEGQLRAVEARLTTAMTSKKPA